MWNNSYEDSEKEMELQMMDLNTLKIIYHDLKSNLKLLKDKKPKESMELACQIIFELIADKSYIEE